jgi:peroxiredoxin Q/BCP
LAATKARTRAKSAKAKVKAVVSRVKGALARVTRRRTSSAKAAAAIPKAKPKRPKRLGHRPSAPLPKSAKAEPKAARRPAPAKEGAPAPSFALLDDKGQVFSSYVLEGEQYIVYFYPRDDTPGCTKEACDFRDRLADFARSAVRVIGISPDSVETHSRFKDKYSLPFTLLSDDDHKVAKAYGVWVKKQNYGREYMGIERSTFLIGKDGKIRKIWRGVKVPGHVDNVLITARQK